ncbi:MAG TPA: cytochrome C oxidase subunit IV family protein [Luteitalea sp.]|nr:cytochrome C oxidase subunit IV family protein [Luteitalea sp.]
MSHQHHIPTKASLFAVFGALMVLTVLTVLVSRVNLGYLNLPVALAVAVTKALLVILLFMEVKYSPKLVQVTAAAGFLFFGIMILYTMTDYLSRNMIGVAGR